MHFGTLLLLGFIAGATILLGLPVGRLKSFSPVWRNGLSKAAQWAAPAILLALLPAALAQSAIPSV